MQSTKVRITSSGLRKKLSGAASCNDDDDESSWVFQPFCESIVVELSDDCESRRRSIKELSWLASIVPLPPPLAKKDDDDDDDDGDDVL